MELRIILFAASTIAAIASVLFLVKNKKHWFVGFPVITLALHMMVFYGVFILHGYGIIAFKNAATIGNFWSDVIRLQSLITIISFLFIAKECLRAMTWTSRNSS